MIASPPIVAAFSFISCITFSAGLLIGIIFDFIRNTDTVPISIYALVGLVDVKIWILNACVGAYTSLVVLVTPPEDLNAPQDVIVINIVSNNVIFNHFLG